MTSTTTDRLAGATAGLSSKAPVRAASTANLTLSGEQTIDAIAVVADDRVLAKNQTDGSENGIYIAASGAWTRAPDFDGARDVVTGTFVVVAEGTAGAGTLWRISTTGSITVGTTSIAFAIMTVESVTAFMETLLDDGDAETALATLTAAGTGIVNTFTKTQSWSKGADIASAATLVLGTDGNYFDVTGTTGISAITVPAGTPFMLQFDGALILTHHATNLDLPGEANITTAAGDVLIGFATGGNTVQVLNYTRADGSLYAGAASAAETKAGTATDKFISPGRLTYHLVASATASASSSIDFTDLSATYFAYQIVFDGVVPATDTAVMWIRTSADNGSTFEAGASDYAYAGVVFSNAVSTGVSDETINQIVFTGALGTGTNEEASGNIVIINPANSSTRTQITGQRSAFVSAPRFEGETLTGMRLAAEANDAIRIIMSTGNIASGNFRLYGLRAA